jgi:hypothetical protein
MRICKLNETGNLLLLSFKIEPLHGNRTDGFVTRLCRSTQPNVLEESTSGDIQFFKASDIKRGIVGLKIHRRLLGTVTAFLVYFRLVLRTFLYRFIWVTFRTLTRHILGSQLSLRA